MGGYSRDIAHAVLSEYGVVAHLLEADEQYQTWGYTRGSVNTLHAFDRRTAAYPPDTLLRICVELGLGDSWDQIRQRIVDRGGWISPRP